MRNLFKLINIERNLIIIILSLVLMMFHICHFQIILYGRMLRIQLKFLLSFHDHLHLRKLDMKGFLSIRRSNDVNKFPTIDDDFLLNFHYSRKIIAFLGMEFYRPENRFEKINITKMFQKFHKNSLYRCKVFSFLNEAHETS